MNLSKSQVKQAVLQEVGNQLDDQKGACETALQQHIGAKSALFSMVKTLEGLFAVADREMDTGDISGLDTLALVKKWIGRAMNATEIKARHTENLEIAMRGRLDQAVRSVDVVLKQFLAEEHRYKAALTAIASGDLLADEDGGVRSVSREVGAHPGMSIKERRNAEEAEFKALKAPKKSKVPKKPRKPRKKKDAKDSG